MLSELLEFLKEDVREGDITTDATIPAGLEVSATVIMGGDGVLAGLEEAALLLEHEGLGHRASFEDGNEVKKGDVVLEIFGNARKILGTERLVLNVLMRMSGIATLTRKLVDIAGPCGVKIAGTRKTTPGFRIFEKKAIEIGGGHPHRLGLDSAFLIKDNHIAIAGLKEAIKQVKDSGISKEVEIEVSSTAKALEACRMGVDIVMLDNMTPDEIERTIRELEKEGLRDNVQVELSGGITAGNLDEYVKTRPDVISMGALTTGSRWLDMSMRIEIGNH